MKFQSILQAATDELRHISNTQLTLELVAELPLNSGAGSIYKNSSAQNTSQHYWIPWTEEMGAWIDANGHHAILVVVESAPIEHIQGSPVLCFAAHIAATCLGLQGQIALHANVVALDGVAIAFAGCSGKGKSTLTTYCVSRGASFVTDDVLVVNDQGQVRPGSPRIKLFPHTGESFGLDASETTTYKIHYAIEQLGITPQNQSFPLGTIYLLEESDRIYTEQLSPSQALLDLLIHSYHVTEIMPDQPSLFYAYTNLVAQVPVKKLFYPRSFESLPKLYDFLQTETHSFTPQLL